MRLTCPSCAAIYEVEDVAIPASGRRVRCGACDESWRVSGDGAPRRITPPPPLAMPASLSRAAEIQEAKASPAPEATEVPAPASPKAPAAEAPPKPVEPESRGLAESEKPEAKAPAPSPASAADKPAPKPAPRPVVRQAEKSMNPGEKPKTAREAKRGESGDVSVGPAESAMRSVMGFLLGFALVVLVFAPYLFRPQIVAIFPAAEPTIDAYNGVLRKAPDALRDGYHFVAGEVGYLLGGLSMDDEQPSETAAGQ